MHSLLCLAEDGQHLASVGFIKLNIHDRSELRSLVVTGLS